MPTDELIIDKLEQVVAEQPPIKLSVIINKIFFFMKIYISSHNSHYQLYETLIYYHNHVFQFDTLSS